MEPITHTPKTIKGIEVLFFEDAEITKTKGSEKFFASFGPLSVLYFKDYNRFILQINGWRYPLLRRLSISSHGNGSYTLPAMNGFSYELKINAKPGQSMTNFNDLLGSIRGLEKSPEDKLMRPVIHKKETGTKEVLTQTFNQIVHKVQNKTATLKSGTKNLTSRKKMVNTKDIKNKDFKKETPSRLKKDFFEATEKISAEFITRRQKNFNLIEPRDMETLRKTTGYDAAVMHLPKEEVEETILLGKDIFALSSPMDPSLDKPTERKGLMENLREGLNSLRRGETRNAAPEVQAQAKKMPISVEGMSHYQG